MIRGLYTSAAGMTNALLKNNTTSNNLANINTNGYKKQVTVEKSFSNTILHKINKDVKAIGQIGSGVGIDHIANDLSEGSYNETNNKLDFAIQGEGFFVIQTPQGERYTRNGQFTLNDLGELVTQDGSLVRGEGGVIQIPEGDQVQIADNNIIVNGRVVDKIQLVDFANKSALVREGNNLFRRGSGVGNTFMANGTIQQGYLEGSNVNPIEEMAKMIENTRVYQADQKIIQAQNDTLGKAVNQVGRV